MLPILGAMLPIISKFFPDKEKQAEFEAELGKELTKQMKMQSDLIKNEQKSDIWIARAIRPLTMLLFVSVILLHYLMFTVAPWLRSVFDIKFFMLSDPGLPTYYVEILKIGMSGYIGARTVEKVAKIWKK